ncbi:MAG TPA: 50S ribosomal protein L4 [Nitrososphaerales archaeon]|nr:50S ribosomal protein L4 [Nitrososphaerales archaeon]
MAEQQVKVLDLEGKLVEAVSLPSVFRMPVREDVINKAYVALDSHRKSVQGRDPLAGERTTAETSNPPTGRGISRIPRVKGERYSKSGMAGGVASTVHGRLPHPPRSEKVIRKEVNLKEKRLALACAIAATARPELVSKRGHRYSGELPIVVSSEIEKVASVRQLRGALSALGMSEELKRIKRGSRKLNSSVSRVKKAGGTGPLLVVADSSNLRSIAKSFAGISIAKSPDLSVLDLAPGSAPGRLTIWSKDALQALTKQVTEIGERYAA